MKISRHWLGDFLAAVPPAGELARRLTFAGLEVEAVESPGAALAGVVVARVEEVSAHPGADKLSVTRVDAGEGRSVRVVCGAKNFRVGDRVPLATVGTVLPGGTAIARATVRGVESEGMLCSARELGVSEDASGLLLLPAEAVPGTPVAQALGLDDAVLEVNVTPNRGDALSHLGVAREVAVLTGQALRRAPVALRESTVGVGEGARVRIEDPAGCRRFAGRVVEGVRIGASPEWLVRRLRACGVRSINNVVDVTNYVMLELGQPLHAFDLDRLAGAELVVRRARPGERLTTLDGKDRPLFAEDLLVCDRDHPHALAGTFGGAQAEVSDATTRVLLEGANWDPVTVRRMARRHQLHTEASHRFERGVDIEAAPAGVDRAAALLTELAGGSVRRGRIDVYPAPRAATVVVLGAGAVARQLGAVVDDAEAERILGALGFEPESRGQGSTSWRVPSWRPDVTLPEDLVEEVARIRGFDTIPATLPALTESLRPEPAEVDVERRVRAALAGAGFDEVLNYSFVDPALLPLVTVRPLQALGAPVEAVELKNPLSPQQSVMRTSLHASLLPNLAHNLRQGQESVRMYELGRVYFRDADGGQGLRPVAREPMQVGGLLWGRRLPRGWTSGDARNDFYDAKGAVETLLAALGAPAPVARPARMAPYHPRASATLSIGDTLLGTVGELHPRVTRALDLPEGVFLFELSLEALAQVAVIVPRLRPLNRFPAVLRDLAVVVLESTPAEEVRRVVAEVGAPLVEEVVIFDVYTGKPLPPGRKNLAFALRYRAADRTLRDEEVQAAHARIVEEVNRRVGAELRA
ncbi:MAG TPA: phenylalanine--tRNA ligase subunit beta [Myxococcaceae bacterium]|nr:phenylalanine--tRNA ligase subunit beta [Myxococcaceae bacterium]